MTLADAFSDEVVFLVGPRGQIERMRLGTYAGLSCDDNRLGWHAVTDERRARRIRDQILNERN